MPTDGNPIDAFLTPLDWGVSGFLHLIKLDVVEKQIDEWSRVLIETEAGPNPTKEGFRFQSRFRVV